MNSGQLDRRVVIQSYTEAQDSQGTPVKTWSTYATRWAKMEKSGGSESYDSDQRVPFRGITWTIRRDTTTAAIDEKMRLVYRSEYYDIDNKQEKTDDRRNGFIVLETIKRGSVDA